MEKEIFGAPVDGIINEEIQTNAERIAQEIMHSWKESTFTPEKMRNNFVLARLLNLPIDIQNQVCEKILSILENKN